MKRTLLALAVLSAFAGGVFAQSTGSVTLFGGIDLALRYVDNNSVSQYQLAQDGLGSSRIGFRGSEDLGGGLIASFWLEGTIQPDTGTIGLASTNGERNNTAALFARRSTVSLAGGWGEVRLGRDYTPTFWNSAIFDPWGIVGVGSAGNLYLSGNLIGVPTGGGYNTLARASNSVSYFLPSGIAGGLYGQLMTAAGENVNGSKYWGGRLGYASGPFNIAGAYGRTQVTSSVDGTNYNFGGSWNFGVLTLSGYYGRLEVGPQAQNNWFIAANAPLGVWTLRASYGQVDRSGGPVEGQKAQQIALGAVYNLSRRTALYGSVAALNNDNGASNAVSPLINVPGNGAVPNMDSRGVEFGILHTF
jgi:predicted porin